MEVIPIQIGADHHMVIFPIIVVISVVLYVYYKVAILKSKDGLTQRYFNAKSRMCLGTFILFFGVNAYVTFQDRLSLFVAIVFLAFGCMQIVTGYKRVKHYRKEWQRLNA